MGKWCPHCKIGKGCVIYSSRPESCRYFTCGWFKGSGNDEHRPDRTKIVFNFFKGGIFEKYLQIWEVSEGKIDGSFARGLAEVALKDGISVNLVYLSGRKELLLIDDISDEMRQALIEEGIEIISV
ncbi:MAG: hypothetical protein Q7S18_01690 [bacterium]|nr:hypothetical protein [bacterium]